MHQLELSQSIPRVKSNKHWQFCVGSGQAKLVVRSDYAKQLKFIHDELGIQRVRFHGIFDDSMQAYMGMDDFMKYPYSKKFKNYNFMNIAVAYDNVLAAGMKPWVELSFMPTRLAGKKPGKQGVNSNGAKCMPKDEVEYKNFIQAFIRFLLDRYGREEVEQWYFEVWNEPNIPVFFMGTQKQYFHLYELTVEAIKKVNPNIKVGGPASAENKWVKEFLAFTKENDIPVDFVSTHYYPGDPLGDAFTSTIMDMFVKSIKRMRNARSGNALDGFRLMNRDKTELSEWPKGQMGTAAEKVRKQAGIYPVYYTEWNCNATLSAFTNDTRKVAAFQMKSIVEMEPHVTGSSVWCFSDIFDEYMLLPYEFQGGFGLLTINGIPKPSFYALKLLSETGDRRLDLPITNAEVEFAAYESDSQMQVFAFRQRMMNVDEPAQDYEIRVQLPKAPSEITIAKIDEEHCNPMKLWEEMGNPDYLTPNQVEYIKERSAMVREPTRWSYEEGFVVITGKLDVNDVHGYQITL